MNIVFLLADQLRADAVGCYGNTIIGTPNIDRLAHEGTRFEQAFCQHPQCAPSRSSFMTGRYPHNNGCISNHVTMAENESTFADFFRSQDYTTYAVGKTHLTDAKNASGFDHTQLSGGQNSDSLTPDALADDYKDWLKANGYWDQAVAAYADHGSPQYRDNFQALPTTLPAEAYIDCWAGDRAVDFIESHDKSRPFLLFAGFPNPHHPFDPPEPYASMYRPEDMPIPATFGSDLNNKPPQQLRYKQKGRAGIGSNYEKLSEEKLRQITAYYYGSISLVDEQIGKILAALERTQTLDDTLIIFTADHGELLGHHGLLLKGTDAFPILYDKSLHVPLIFRHPKHVSANHHVTTPVELLDLFPTMAATAGLTPPPQIQGHDLSAALKGEAYEGRDSIYAESGPVKMLRCDEWKLVYYPDQDYGELYNLQNDPDESVNLFASTEHRPVRDRLTQTLLNRLITMEAPLDGPSKKGPAYWRQSYLMPFADD